MELRLSYQPLHVSSIPLCVFLIQRFNGYANLKYQVFSLSMTLKVLFHCTLASAKWLYDLLAANHLSSDSTCDFPCLWVFSPSFLFVCLIFEAGSYYVGLGVLEVTM